MTEEITKAVKDFIVREFLPGENPDQLTETTPLITGGVLDSIATLKLVLFIEERFAITLAAHEANREHLDTIADVTRLVLSKRAKASRESA